MSKDNIKKYRDKIDVIDKKILRLIQEKGHLMQYPLVS